MTISIDHLARRASNEYNMGILLKKDGHHKRALDYFEYAAEKYEVLANKADSTANRLDYLTAQRECLRDMLVDTYLCNRKRWCEIMLEIKDITDTIKAIEEN